jgi:hypothetical protein
LFSEMRKALAQLLPGNGQSEGSGPPLATELAGREALNRPSARTPL